jgi:hypothetical protein
MTITLTGIKFGTKQPRENSEGTVTLTLSNDAATEITIAFSKFFPVIAPAAMRLVFSSANVNSWNFTVRLDTAPISA